MVAAIVHVMIEFREWPESVSYTHLFGYSTDRILMKDVSLSVRPGQKIAIVGSTGAGKTTLIKDVYKRQ